MPQKIFVSISARLRDGEGHDLWLVYILIDKHVACSNLARYRGSSHISIFTQVAGAVPASSNITHPPKLTSSLPCPGWGSIYQMF